MNLKSIFSLIVLGLISSILVIILFKVSEQGVHQNNGFTRQYPPHPILKKHSIDLGYNSYYIAGQNDSIIYLGNRTAPSHLLRLNVKTKDTQHIKIIFPSQNLEYRNIYTKVLETYFFTMDGTIPFILRGKIGVWKAELWSSQDAYFNNAVPIDSNAIFMRTVYSPTRNTELAIMKKIQDSSVLKFNTQVLVKQVDGNFDVNGTLVFSELEYHLGYAYFYRNQFMIMDKDLELIAKMNTIDTISHTTIKVANLEKDQISKLSIPPLVINESFFLSGDLALTMSRRVGKFENPKILKQASIIDVYNWKQKSYLFSFHIYNNGKSAARDFVLLKDYFCALFGSTIIVYNIDKNRFQHKEFL